ncbi:putative acid phosphatase of HAD superfamily subfamily IIIB [Krasilnikovia cinnamomea]|uniref:Putative acid phosphatase of HAD superfamily subfamily IIIB n=1 Tax=Krasilnikovia cinnamomea TaxID=349313 RepID=A0A4Q7ZQP7_9ACTN|nr:HAD family acid phosphatase [Krasilnikovia cinnamomea]RZU53452.1 putative acid phosphatase of HAD superfamily subfamily IIIB [Krasilnikovia cinnamomea]
MTPRLRSGLLALLTTTTITLGAPAAAYGAPPAAPSIAGHSLPPYQTWIADVTAVTSAAQRYLADRLPDSSVKPAIVLDIDNTALETTYRPGLVSPATAPVLALARQAAADGAAVFFVTARPQVLGWQTAVNLRGAGYPVADAYLRPWFNTQPDAGFKTATRKQIEDLGYRIVANIGNNPSDLSGGFAERTFKLPDYDGQLI